MYICIYVYMYIYIYIYIYIYTYMYRSILDSSEGTKDAILDVTEDTYSGSRSEYPPNSSRSPANQEFLVNMLAQSLAYVQTG